MLLLITLHSPSIFESIIYFDKADYIWNDMKEWISEEDLLLIAEFHEEVYSLKQGTFTVTDYYTYLLSKDLSQPELHHPLPQSAVRNYSHSISSATNGSFASSIEEYHDGNPTQMTARIESSPHERPNQFTTEK